MRPLAYHGAGKSGPYFEGWYFKLIAADGRNRLSIIPGVYIGGDAEQSHAFIQVMDGVDGSSHYIPFPTEAFSFVPGKMNVTLADNHLPKKKYHLISIGRIFNSMDRFNLVD